MDKLTLISGTLFMAADIFAIVSLAMPDWIITDVGGEQSKTVPDPTFYRVLFRRHPPGSDVDLHDSLQQAPSVFHA
jgi:hypothetical protein